MSAMVVPVCHSYPPGRAAEPKTRSFALEAVDDPAGHEASALDPTSVIRARRVVTKYGNVGAGARPEQRFGRQAGRDVRPSQWERIG